MSALHVTPGAAENVEFAFIEDLTFITICN